MRYGSFDGSFQAAVQIAIDATGGTGVQALENNVRSLKKEIEDYQAQLKAGQPVTQAALNDLANLSRQLQQANDVYQAAQRANQGYQAAIKDTAFNTQAASRGFLELSRAAEDFSTGGFLGVLNQVPGITRSIGQTMGLASPQVAALEAALSLTATAAYTLWKNWDSVQAAFSDGVGEKIIPGLTEVNRQIDQLKDKKIPTLVDQQDLHNLERQAVLLGRIESANKAQQGMTDDQRKAGEIVNEGVREGSGGDDQRIIRAVMAARANEISPAMQKIRDDYQDLMQTVNRLKSEGRNDYAESMLQENLPDLQKRQKDQAAIDKSDRYKSAVRWLGEAGSGNEISRGALAHIYDSAREKFEAEGVTYRFRQALEDARPDRLHREEQAKLAADAEKDYKDEAKKAADEEAKADAFYEREEREGAERQARGMEKLRTDHAEEVAKQAKRDASVAAAARKRELDEVDDGILPGAKALIAQNQLGIENQLPIAHSGRQMQQFAGSGQNFALSDEGIRSLVQSEIARVLKMAGRNPDLAPDLTKRAFDQTGAAQTRGIAEVGTDVGEMAGIVGKTHRVVGQAQQQVGGLMGQMAALQAQVDRLEKKNASLQFNQARIRQQQQQRRPSILAIPPEF